MIDPVIYLPPRIWQNPTDKNRARRWPWRGRRWQ